MSDTDESIRAAGRTLRAFLEGLLGVGVTSTASGKVDGKSKQAMDSFIEEVINQGQLDKIGQYMSPDLDDHYQPPGYPRGVEGVQQRFEAFNAAFTYQGSERPIVFAHDSYLVQIGTTYFTHTGDWMGIPPTNQRVKVGGVEVFRFQDGKAVERWGMWDVINLADQLGALLTPVAQPAGVVEAAARERRIALG